VPPTRLDRGDDIVQIARNDDADRDLPVVRCVGRVQRPRPLVEPNLTAEVRGDLSG
jgi:hypothetical protein